MSKAYLILENGKVFEGKPFGKLGKVKGEVVFNTGMVGYLETLTDKNNYGQIVIQTFPMIGNYGFIGEDLQSEKVQVSGYVAREICDKPSNFRCEGTIEDYLKQNEVIGICGIDTRALTRILREEGTMNGMITDCGEVTDEVLAEIKNFKVTDAVKSVKGEAKQEKTPFSKYRVAVYDFGCGKSVIDTLLKLDCEVHVMPYDTTAEEILAINPDGILISDGPGDPKECLAQVEEIKKLFTSDAAIFGIGLGHLLMALANGADTTKLTYGHRGASGPCKNLDTGVLSIITQNHGYCVVRDGLPSSMTVSHENANDKTIEGLSYDKKNTFSVQFRPDTQESPTGEKSLYEAFVNLCKEVKLHAVK